MIYLAVRQDGTELLIEGTFSPRMDVDGCLKEVVETAVDVVERQRMAEDAKDELAAISASHSTVEFSVDGTIVDANAKFLHAMGYRHDEVVGQHHRMFVDPDHADTAEYRAFWAELAEGRHQTSLFQRFGKGGRETWLRATYTPVVGSDGAVKKIVKHAVDVTRENRRHADDQWQIAAIHKSHAVVTFDMDGTILDANPAFLEAVGYQLHEIEGHHHRLFVEASYAHGSEYAAFWRALGRGEHQTGHYRRFGKGGRELWLQSSYNPVFGADGRPVKIVKYATEITEEKLRQAEHQGQIAAIHKSQCVISFDLQGHILDANDNFLQAMGYRLSEVRGRHHSMFVGAEEAASRPYAEFWAQLAFGNFQSAEFKRFSKDGREVWLKATYNPIFDLAGRPFKVIKYASDITTEKFSTAEMQGQITAIHKSQGVITFDMQGMILEANDKILEVTGYSADELIGRHHSVMVDRGVTQTQDYADFWAKLQTGAFTAGMYKRLGKDGREVWIQASYNPILDLNGRPTKIVKFATDVSANVALAEAFEDAKRQAQHDPATALPNRARLASFMSSMLVAPDSPLVVLYIDLDRFKPINDTFGHHVGDMVLGEVADRLRRCLAPDQLAARVGGDEFVVVVPQMSEARLEVFCQQLMSAVSHPIRHEMGELKVGASIGVAIAPADGKTPDELLRCADIALYRAKQSGRGMHCFYSTGLNDRSIAYRDMVGDITQALASEEFLLEYQPRFDTKTRSVQSVEALVRWNHPIRGRISPGAFISIAERSGQIVPLGQWVLRTACRAATEWPGIGVSVNISPVQFTSVDVVQLVTETLEETGLEPSRLELEITEGVLLDDAARARTALEALKLLGVRLAMDDFGTGYSSLSSLRSFPFDVIKIDRQFIEDLEHRSGGRAVVQAILGLGKGLGLSVTAEGVETPQQLDVLRADDCTEVQGFLLARPMPASEVSELLHAEAQAR